MTGFLRWQKLAAEFLGTAFLVAIGAGSVPAAAIVSGRGVGEPITFVELGIVALAFGTIVAVTVYAFGYVSGNHINPAVTVALAVSGKFAWKDVPGYVIAQLAGATVGAIAIIGVLGTQASEAGLGVVSYADATPIWQAFTAEFIGTFILVATVFGVIHRKAADGFAGLAIGLVVFAVILPVAPTTGAPLNPARMIGPMIIQEFFGEQVPWSQLPLYLLAQLAAGVTAAIVMAKVTATHAHELHHWWEADDED